jgi:hypothetical protein
VAANDPSEPMLKADNAPLLVTKISALAPTLFVMVAADI